MKNRGLNFRKRRRKKISVAIIKEILSWFFWIFVSAFLAIVLMIVFGLRTNIIGNSMEPNLYSGQHILINRLVYSVSSPKKGDVVAFLPNGNEKSHYYVKRVIGVPGDTIQIINGRVYINDVQLEESNSYDKIADPGIAINPIYLNDDEYFVLGDNRNFSEDSRSGNIGIVYKQYMIGKVWFKVSDQLDKIGFVK